MTEAPGNDQIFINRLTEIILANLGNENFGVDELARAAGMTTQSLRQRLHEITNKNIAQFIRETRLLKSLEILKNEKLTAAEVAYKTGFSSPAYFNTCFHEFFGYSPGEVKKGNIKVPVEEKQKLNNTKSSQPKSYLKRIVIASVSILISLILVVTGFYLLANEDSPDPEERNSGDLKSIAVLPFKNLSDSDSNYYFIEGTMEEILTNLSKINDLRVISRTSVEQFRNSSLTVTSIGRKLKADYIVEASGQKIGSNLKLRVQLIDAVNDRHVWAETYEVVIREVKDIFRIQVLIAQEIASELKASITPQEKELIEKTHTYSLTAYDFFQRGRAELVKVGLYGAGFETLARSEYLLRKALEYDPEYAQAYSALSNVYWSHFHFAFNSPDMDINICNKYLDSMLIMADLALSFDHRLLDALNARGFYFSIKGTADQALEEWEKSIRYNPNDFLAYVFTSGVYFSIDLLKSIEYTHEAASHNDGSTLPSSIRAIAFKYFQAGFPEQGNFYLMEALKLDGDSVMYSDIKNMLGRDKNDPVEKAVNYIEKRCQTNPNNLYYFVLGYYNSLLGLHKESLNYFKKIDAVKFAHSNPSYNYIFRTWIGFAYQKNGYINEADSCFSQYIDICTKKLPLIQFWDRPNALYGLAGAYLCKGDKQKAYENLRLFSQYPSYVSDYVFWLKNDPVFSCIRNEPEFREIVKDVETKYLNQHEKVGKWLEERTPAK